MKKKPVTSTLKIREDFKMEIKQHHLQKFIALYKMEFGITLSPIDAQQKLFTLIEFARLCRMPVAKINVNAINNMPNESE